MALSKGVLIFVIILGGMMLLAVGWSVGRQARQGCEAMASERQAAREPQYDVKDCLAARLLNGGA